MQQEQKNSMDLIHRGLFFVCIVQHFFQYLFAFVLTQDAFFHVIKHLNEAKVHVFLFCRVGHKGVKENKGNIFQVLPTTGTKKETFHKPGIAFGNIVDGILEVLVHKAKMDGERGKETLDFDRLNCKVKVATRCSTSHCFHGASNVLGPSSFTSS